MNHQQYTRYTCLMLACSLFLLTGCANEVEDASAANFTDPLTQENMRLLKPPNIIVKRDLQLLQIDGFAGARLLPELKQARVRRDGVVRWLEIDLPISNIWPVARAFWLDQGFNIVVDIPEAGLLETNWQQDHSQVLGTGLSRYLDVALGTVNDTGIRNQFRTRIERGDNNGQTNIYITHRAIEQGGIGTDGLFTSLPSDRILEIEMIRRMMIAFRLPEESIASLSLLAENTTNDLYTIDNHTLTILRDRDTAWRILLLGLDRSGFTVIDKDPEAGLITMQIANPTLPKEQQGFFASLFNSGQQDGAPREINLTMNNIDASRVQVTAPTTEEGASILRIIAKNI